MSSKYASLSREELESRLAEYEARTTESVASQGYASTTEPIGGPSRTFEQSSRPAGSSSSLRPGRKAKQTKPAKAFNFHSYPTRHIALLLSYHGSPYSGLAIQSLPQDEYPTIEGELLKALEKSKLIEEGTGWGGCDFSRCGRTDRGVSGAGQVVDLWVRSNMRKEDVSNAEGSWRDARDPPMPKMPKLQEADEVSNSKQNGDIVEGTKVVNGGDVDSPPPPKVSSELPFVKILNSSLPPSIRVLAWSPTSPDFNSRFSCKYRHYKYAFHRSASPGVAPLDLDLMRTAANLLVGDHDFRNFCRLDGSKQIENHSRRVLKAYFDESEAGPEGMVAFNLVGTAFLWHQVRHIMAILFLVGAKLERPEMVAELLNVETMPRRPLYHMAQALPLRLHECGYPEGELDWRVGSCDGPMNALTTKDEEDERAARLKQEKELDAAKQDAEIRAWQVSSALGRFKEVLGEKTPASDTGGQEGKAAYPLGGGEMVESRKYKLLRDLRKGDLVEEVNRLWREGKGQARMAGVVNGGDE